MAFGLCGDELACKEGVLHLNGFGHRLKGLKGEGKKGKQNNR